MANLIKYIASFSDDAVHNAIEQAVGAEKEKFIDVLKTIQSRLEKPPVKLKKEPTIVQLSDKTIFEQKIRPQIVAKLEEYDRLETVGKDVEWKVRLGFLGDYMLLNLDELKKRHAMILEEKSFLPRPCG